MKNYITFPLKKLIRNKYLMDIFKRNNSRFSLKLTENCECPEVSFPKIYVVLEHSCFIFKQSI